ncbi:unnamed protein product [Cyprideis torosa]|uniref:Uncharacterized protein n=1 Tax=Cyprideis torosa TaxID=163714 RepID=A0A7R8ZHA0_9CRUS|nr:unnamed protein product [Cyprideis torosa]CAG0883206.1 unnamed protein product [Cyprideis torosa]
MESDVPLHVALLAGAVAGMSVDLALFPLDTLKTRLQSANGFQHSGGFSGIYRGIGPVILGSAPGAAIFFMSYESMKSAISSTLGLSSYSAWNHLLASSIGEVAACAVRVPVEVVKQRRQVGMYLGAGLATVVRSTYRGGGVAGFYRGFGSTVFREIPFSAIQFPLWEALKVQVAHARGRNTASPAEAALCGTVAGGIASFLTTPFDVVKTRIMLLQGGGIYSTFLDVYRTRGVRGLFAGAVPRVTWISIGGFIFLGSYEQVKSIFQGLSATPPPPCLLKP